MSVRPCVRSSRVATYLAFKFWISTWAPSYLPVPPRTPTHPGFSRHGYRVLIRPGRF
ncbi:hypothetical protein C8Q74DRAFT_1297587 [Fomes fomentarius]|nr:hypothetical protein C8Q74DRAFT_1297587 [Fomes fomentarius]